MDTSSGGLFQKKIQKPLKSFGHCFNWSKSFYELLIHLLHISSLLCQVHSSSSSPFSPSSFPFTHLSFSPLLQICCSLSPTLHPLHLHSPSNHSTYLPSGNKLGLSNHKRYQIEFNGQNHDLWR